LAHPHHRVETNISGEASDAEWEKCMADREHLRLLESGLDMWNNWRNDNPSIRPDLGGANLSGAHLVGADLRAVNFAGADLAQADLFEAELYMANLHEARLSGARLAHAQLVWANLTKADLSSANLHRADLQRADAAGANFRGADLSEANLLRADLSEADLGGADLTLAALMGTILVETIVDQARLVETLVYGVAAWDLRGTPRIQRDLLVSKSTSEPDQITVDDIEMAQFIYLLLSNERIREIIDTTTSKLVLILGRFTASRKDVLDRLRVHLRHRDLVPVLFDSARPTSKDVTGTIEILARMARFIVADVTNPRSISHELAFVVPHLRTTPVVPLKLNGSTGYSMFDDLKAYPWVLPVHEYRSPAELLREIEHVVIGPAEEKRRALLASLNAGP
jgi:uncharacterized protein YjbI with pentapeptide repeats